MVPGLSRCKDDGSVRDELQALGNKAAVGFGTFNLLIGMRIFAFTLGPALRLGQVPLIDNHHYTFGMLLNLTGNVCILGSQALASINEQQDHVRAFNSARRAQNAEFLNAWPDLATPANTSGINEDKFFVLELDLSI